MEFEIITLFLTIIIPSIGIILGIRSFVKRAQRRRNARRMDKEMYKQNVKECPYCKMAIHRDATICPYCRREQKLIWKDVFREL